MWWNRTSFFEFDRKSIETESTIWSGFPNRGKTILEQILASEERNKSKIGLWGSQSGVRVGKWTISVRSFEIEKLQQSSPGLSVPPE